MNFQVNDNTNTAGSPGEVLSRRCVTLLKTALRPDMWSKSELKLQWFDKLLMSVVGVGVCCCYLGLGLNHQNLNLHSFGHFCPLPLCLLAAVNLKNKITGYFTSKMGMALRMASNSKVHKASPANKREECYFLERKKDNERGHFEQKSVGGMEEI